MDGINPTLALAALLFGMSGNPQNETSAMNAQIQDRAACVVVADARDPAQVPQGTDPVARRSVAAASVGPATDGCKPER